METSILDRGGAPSTAKCRSRRVLIASVDAPAVALVRAAPPHPADYRTACGTALSFGEKQTIVAHGVDPALRAAHAHRHRGHGTDVDPDRRASG